MNSFEDFNVAGQKNPLNFLVQAPALIALFQGREGICVFSNAMFSQVWGRRSVIGKPMREAWPELDGKGWFEIIEEVYDNGETRYTYEQSTQVDRDGERRESFFNYIFSPYVGAENLITGVMVFGFDVSDNVRIKKKLEESREELRNERGRYFNLFSVAPSGIALITGEDLLIEFANPKIRSLFPRHSSMVGKTVRDLFPEIENSWIHILHGVGKEKKAFYAAEVPWIMDWDGNSIPYARNFSLHLEPFDKEDRAEGLICFVYDISEQVMARKRMQEGELKYHSLINTMDQGFCIIDVIFNEQDDPVDYIFLEYNHTFENQTGLKNVLGKNVKSFLPDLEESWFRIYGSIAKTGEPSRFVQGSEVMGRWFDVFAFKMGDQDSRNVGILFKDITAQKRSEEKLEQIMAELEERVQQRTKELKHTNLALKQSNENLMQFAHVASHDLKEPVRKIQTFVSRVIHDLSMDNRNALMRDLLKIQSAAQRMSTMIEGVLTYSTLNNETQQIGQVDLNDVVQSIANDLEILIDEKKAQLFLQPLPIIEGAGLLLYQLFYNLLNNALKFSRMEESPVIYVGASIFENEGIEYASIRVKDNGIGFDPNFANSIFDAFYRLNPKDSYEGTGLGLSLCKKITERHHGRIRAESTPGQGAEFIVELPIRQPHAFL